MFRTLELMKNLGVEVTIRNPDVAYDGMEGRGSPKKLTGPLAWGIRYSDKKQETLQRGGRERMNSEVVL